MSKLHAETCLYSERAGRAILWQMSNEFAAPSDPLTPSRVVMLGSATYQGGKALNTLTVSTLDAGHRRSLTGYGVEDIVSYRAIPNPRHSGWFMLERSQYSALSSGSSPMPIIVADNLISLKFSYFDGQQWSQVWNSENLSPGRQLPVAMTIDLNLAGPRGIPLPFSTEVTLPLSIQQW